MIPFSLARLSIWTIRVRISLAAFRTSSEAFESSIVLTRTLLCPRCLPDGEVLVRSFQALIAPVKSLREMLALMLELAAPGRGVQSRSKTVLLSKNVPGGILISVPSGRREVLKSAAETPTSDNG